VRHDGDVAHPTDWVLVALRVHGVELVREAHVDVRAEAAFACPILTDRVERLDHIRAAVYAVISAQLAVLAGLRQVLHVDDEVLSPVLNVLINGETGEAFLHPIADVVGIAFVEFEEVLWDAETVLTDVVPRAGVEHDFVVLTVGLGGWGCSDLYQVHRHCAANMPHTINLFADSNESLDESIL